MHIENLVGSANISGNPFKVSEYFDLAESSMDRHWSYFVEPTLSQFSLGSVIDLAVGYGRNTEKFRHLADNVIGVDINQECIDYCSERFAGVGNVSLIKTDGTRLSGIADNTIDLVYSFDAMVHFEPEIVDAYIGEFSRVLRPGGKGFIHHSNWTSALGGSFQQQPHWRNFMSKELFGYLLYKNGLKITSQKVIGWDESMPNAEDSPVFIPNLDCISLFEK